MLLLCLSPVIYFLTLSVFSLVFSIIKYLFSFSCFRFAFFLSYVLSLALVGLRLRRLYSRESVWDFLGLHFNYLLLFNILLFFVVFAAQKLNLYILPQLRKRFCFYVNFTLSSCNQMQIIFQLFFLEILTPLLMLEYDIFDSLDCLSWSLNFLPQKLEEILYCHAIFRFIDGDYFCKFIFLIAWFLLHQSYIIQN